MKIEKIKQEVYKRGDDGVVSLIETKEIERQSPSTEDLIVEKETELLKMYKEIEELKKLRNEG